MYATFFSTKMVEYSTGQAGVGELNKAIFQLTDWQTELPWEGDIIRSCKMKTQQRALFALQHSHTHTHTFIQINEVGSKSSNSCSSSGGATVIIMEEEEEEEDWSRGPLTSGWTERLCWPQSSEPIHPILFIVTVIIIHAGGWSVFIIRIEWKWQLPQSLLQYNPIVMCQVWCNLCFLLFVYFNMLSFIYWLIDLFIHFFNDVVMEPFFLHSTWIVLIIVTNILNSSSLSDSADFKI